MTYSVEKVLEGGIVEAPYCHNRKNKISMLGHLTVFVSNYS